MGEYFKKINLYKHRPSAVEAVTRAMIKRFRGLNSFIAEQWTVVIDRQAKTGVLRGGDIGWQREVQIRDDAFDDLLLSRDEFLWLAACWRAATAGMLRGPEPAFVDGPGSAAAV